MISTNKRYHKYLIAAAAVILLLGIGLGILFSKRDQMLNSRIEQLITAQRQYNHLDLKIQKRRIVGLSRVAFEEISLVPIGSKDTLLHIRDFEVSIKLWPLLFGHLKPRKLLLVDGDLNFIDRHGTKNYAFLLKEGALPREDKKEDIDLGALVNRLIERALYKIPDNLRIENLKASYSETDSNLHLSVWAKEVAIEQQELRSTFIVNQGDTATWHFRGHIDGEKQQLDVKLYAQGKKVEFPFLAKKYNLKLSFDTLSTRMDGTEYKNNQLHIRGAWGINGLWLDHPKISAHNIILKKGAMDAEIVIGKDFLELDSSTVIRMGSIQANPFLKYTSKPTKSYALGLHTGWLDAQAFFDAFPKGAFESLEGMAVQGKLKYDLDFFLDDKYPDACTLFSSLDKQGFKITHYGAVDLQKINKPFVYTPFEYGKPMRDIVIGPANPRFTPYAQISPLLKNSILVAEDYTFFKHKGFYEEAFRRSIAENYKSKTFKRGGSTISMQLVKNVYLSRQKTIARKLEEMLIVWLIENNALTDKQRMFEVYLNIIEWGPNIYGIGEASQFYFDKQPAQLNLGEAMFLTSIIPSPKKYRRQFNPNGSLKERVGVSYFNLISGLLRRKGMITEDDLGGMHNVSLRGLARKYVITEPDSAAYDEPELQSVDESRIQ